MSKSVALDLGLVVAGHGRHYIVESPEGGRIVCHPRGKKSDCVVGDRVRWQPSGDEGVIEHVEPRRNLLFRQDEWKTKSFAANLDQLMVLVAAEPVFSESQLARALIAAESAGIQSAEERSQGWAPRLVVPAPQAEAEEDEVAEIVAENLMLKAKLRLEAERRDELQILLAQEIRELRAHIKQEIENLEDLRAERDLWKARCEALLQPLFQQG